MYLFSILILALSLPLQASAATLYDVRQSIKNFYYGEITGDIYDAQSIEELMSMIKDPYTVYYTKDEYIQFSQSIEQETVGIGVTVEEHEQGVYISGIINSGPAQKAGLAIGDIITHVNGTSVVGMPLSEAISYITGEPNTTVTLNLLRTNGSHQTVTIVRKSFQLPNTVSAMLYGNVGYISLATFSSTAAREVSKAIGSLKKSGAKEFILDLQNNGGGYVDVAIDIMSMFPNTKIAMNLHDKDGVTPISVTDYMSYEAKAYNKFPTGKVSLLINGASASASDMTAGAVKDQNAAKLYGTTSYGKGLMQSIEEYNDGSALKVTIAEFRTPKGDVINNIGIEPHVVTQTPIASSHFDIIKKSLTKHKELPSLTNVPKSKTFTLSLTKEVQANSVEKSIELVQLGGQKVDITTKVNGSKITITPVKPLDVGSQYTLIVHPTLKDAKGKTLKKGSYMHITVQK